MLILADKLYKISFCQLMDVYAESNLSRARKLTPSEPYGRGLLEAEQDFYSYLQDVFFKLPGAFYAVLEENGRYVSALRLEPFLDGLLLEALETHPDFRGKGYAEKLVSSVQEHMSECGCSRIYSHIRKTNAASLHVHRKCGFWIEADYASFIDGSVSNQSVTMVYEKK